MKIVTSILLSVIAIGLLLGASDSVTLPTDTTNTGKKIRVNSRTVGIDTVYEYYHILQDPTNDDQARVLTAAPSSGDGGLVVRNLPSGTQAVSLGSIAVNGTVPISLGSVSINGAIPAGANNVGSMTLATSANVIGHVVVDTAPTTAVTGAFYQATQPVSLAALPALIASSANIGSVTIANASLPVSLGSIAINGIAAVTGTFWQATQPISLGSISINGAIPAGANNIGSVTLANSSVAVTLAAGAGAIAKAEDVASADADVGVPSMAIQKATPADTAGTDGDYSMLQMSAGRLWTSSKIDTAIPAGSNNIGSFTLANASVAVTGTFWQSTQPVSIGSIVLNTGTNSIGTITNGGGTVQLVAGSANIGSVTIANASVAVGLASIAINGAVPAGGNNIGSVTLAGNPILGIGTNSIGTVTLAASSANIGSVTLAASTASIGTILNGGGTVALAASSANVGSVTLAASTAAIGTVTNGGGTVQLVAGSTNIGSVTLAASSNNIGSITVAGLLDTTTGDTGAKAATFAGATQTNSTGAAGAIITVKCGTVSGTSPTLSCQLQYSYDGGTTWLNIGIAIPNLTATNNVGVYLVGPNNWSTAGSSPATLTSGGTQTAALNMRLPKTWRINYTIGGTTPSFAITNVYVNYTN